LSFAGKWMEMEIVMLSEAKLENTNITCSHSLVETRPKMIGVVMVTMIIITNKNSYRTWV
jgi:hypothetical protein